MTVVVTGMGLITPLAVGARALWRRLVAGESGIISTSKLGPEWDQIPAKVVGKVPLGSIADEKWDSKDHFSAAEAGRLALFSQYALVAVKEALEDAAVDLKLVDLDRAGIALGSGIGSFVDLYDNSMLMQKGGYKRVQPFFIPKLLVNMAAGNVSIKYGLKGPLHTPSTACATGLHAVGDAMNFIENGYADMMVCGGSEATIHPLALAGFSRAKAVVTGFGDTPEALSRPFDADRAGFVLGEGCGVLVLEKLEHAKRRNARIYAQVAGYGLSGDAHHVTAPAEDGNGGYRAMKMALERANISPEDVDHVNPHATSTIIGDRAENNAMLRLFANNDKLKISATKALVGHLLGAAGAVEAAFTVKAIETGTVPPTLNLHNPGRHEGDDPLKFTKFDYVPLKSQRTSVDVGLCNSFGFGGVNASVCFKKYVE